MIEKLDNIEEETFPLRPANCWIKIVTDQSTAKPEFYVNNLATAQDIDRAIDNMEKMMQGIYEKVQEWKYQQFVFDNAKSKTK